MNQFSDFFQKKAYEISYALMRLCSAIRELELRSRISASAVRLVEYSVVAGMNEAGRQDLKQTVITLRQLVQFGEGIGEISYRNAEVVLGEIGHLIQGIEEAERVREEVRIEHLFSDSAILEDAETETRKRKSNAFPRTETEKGNSALQQTERQKNILEFISGNGNCQMKDIVSAFPDVSDRTIRNDLRQLVSAGDIRRTSTGVYEMESARISTQ